MSFNKRCFSFFGSFLSLCVQESKRKKWTYKNINYFFMYFLCRQKVPKNSRPIVPFTQNIIFTKARQLGLSKLSNKLNWSVCYFFPALKQTSLVVVHIIFCSSFYKGRLSCCWIQGSKSFQGGWFGVTMSIVNRNEKVNRLKTQRTTQNVFKVILFIITFIHGKTLQVKFE